MLLIARTARQSFWVGDVLVEVLEVGSRQVHFGISGPREVEVARGELVGELAGARVQVMADHRRRLEGTARHEVYRV